MTGKVAGMVTGNPFWTYAVIAMIVGYCAVMAYQTLNHIIGRNVRNIRALIRQRARMCLARTGFAGALIARHTVLVTVNLLVLNIALNFLSYIERMDHVAGDDLMLKRWLETLAGVCLSLIVIIALLIFALCDEVIRQSEKEE